MPISPLRTSNFIDSCAFDPKYKPEDEASTEIFKLAGEGRLLVQIAHSMYRNFNNFWIASQKNARNDGSEILSLRAFFAKQSMFIQKEIAHPNTPIWVKSEAKRLIYTIDVSLTVPEINRLKEIEAILAGNGKVENIRDDARHVFEAQKYGSYFITTDSRILSRAAKLPVCVLKPSEFLSIVNQDLAKR